MAWEVQTVPPPPPSLCVHTTYPSITFTVEQHTLLPATAADAAATHTRWNTLYIYRHFHTHNLVVLLLVILLDTALMHTASMHAAC